MSSVTVKTLARSNSALATHFLTRFGFRPYSETASFTAFSPCMTSRATPPSVPPGAAFPSALRTSLPSPT